MTSYLILRTKGTNCQGKEVILAFFSFQVDPTDTCNRDESQLLCLIVFLDFFSFILIFAKETSWQIFAVPYNNIDKFKYPLKFHFQFEFKFILRRKLNCLSSNYNGVIFVSSDCSSQFLCPRNLF